MALKLDSRFIGDVYVLECVGSLVLGAEAKALETALEQGAVESSRFVLEISEVDRMDSIGLGTLVLFATRMRKRGGDIRLAAAPPFLVKLLELTRLSSLLETFATEEDAVLSFLRQRAAEETTKRAGARVLVFDQSAELCVFVRSVLTRHGFDVRSTTSFRDAKTLLRAEEVEYLLTGAGTEFLTSEAALGALRAVGPRAKTMQLDSGFQRRDAGEATAHLLQMFGVAGS